MQFQAGTCSSARFVLGVCVCLCISGSSRIVNKNKNICSCHESGICGTSVGKNQNPKNLLPRDCSLTMYSYPQAVHWPSGGSLQSKMLHCVVRSQQSGQYVVVVFNGVFAQSFRVRRHLRKFSLKFRRMQLAEERQMVNGVKATVVKINYSIVNVLHSTLATEHT